MRTLSLYFNCKLTNKKLIGNSIREGYFYPVIYPINPARTKETQYSVLIKTLESYSVFDFRNSVFNIEIDSITEDERNELESLIKRYFYNSKPIIKFNRPSSISSWVSDIDSVGNLIGKTSPVLVVMNHDHIFVDDDTDSFITLTKSIFDGKDFRKALYYSHAPELISNALNGIAYGRFAVSDYGVFESKVVNKWLDSYCVMTLETLKHIFLNAEFGCDYIGRIDWPGVKYKKLGLRTYVFPREYFRHFDEYGHVTGVRTEFVQKILENYASISEREALLLKYFRRWFDTFYIYLRDGLSHKTKISKSTFIDLIDNSLFFFKIGYLDQDLIFGKITIEQSNEVEVDLRNMIFFHANQIWIELMTDSYLLNSDKKLSFKSLIPRKLYACINSLGLS